MIAGFESPTSGRIVVDGRDVTNLPPQTRAIGMVFQNYALFPHMTVFENVAFGLETAHLPKSEIRVRVEKILDAVNLREKIHAQVPNLSGGEQQRAAVARALVVEPTVLLFDEPLSNLDVALRWKTREEIRSLQHKTNITTVYVTHDQSEAMSLSDRIAVMREGRLEQIGAPSEIYERPASPFIAQFVGGANLLVGMLDKSSRRLTVGAFKAQLPSRSDSIDGKVTVSVKPEAISLHLRPDEATADAIVKEKEYLGFTTHFVIAASGILLRVASLSSQVTAQITPGMHVRFHIDLSRCSIFPEE